MLWSEGVQAKRPLEHLLIKGRNLYRARGDSEILRQPWLDESARQCVLDEKHGRGDAARRKRRQGPLVCVCVWGGGGKEGEARAITYQCMLVQATLSLVVGQIQHSTPYMTGWW